MTAQRDWYEKDFYKVLGVAEDATPKDITKAYRRLARDNHPDTNPDNVAAENRFKDVSAAYDVVGDEAKRKEYDEVRRLGPAGGMGFGGGGGNTGPFNFNVGADGLGDLLGGMFNRRLVGDETGLRDSLVLHNFAVVVLPKPGGVINHRMNFQRRGLRLAKVITLTKINIGIERNHGLRFGFNPFQHNKRTGLMQQGNDAR